MKANEWNQLTQLIEEWAAESWRSNASKRILISRILNTYHNDNKHPGADGYLETRRELKRIFHGRISFKDDHKNEDSQPSVEIGRKLDL